jgi:hypothetical protein
VLAKKFGMPLLRIELAVRENMVQDRSTNKGNYLKMFQPFVFDANVRIHSI